MIKERKKSKGSINDGVGEGGDVGWRTHGSAEDTMTTEGGGAVTAKHGRDAVGWGEGVISKGINDGHEGGDNRGTAGGVGEGGAIDGRLTSSEEETKGGGTTVGHI